MKGNTPPTLRSGISSQIQQANPLSTHYSIIYLAPLNAIDTHYVAAYNSPFAQKLPEFASRHRASLNTPCPG